VSDFDVAESRRSDALVIWSIWTSTKLVLLLPGRFRSARQAVRRAFAKNVEIKTENQGRRC